jgi:protein SCO1/2
MNRRSLAGGLAGLLALHTIPRSAFAAASPAYKTGVFEPPRPAPDFSLRGSNGAEIKLSQYRGKVVALGFGYTSCPDVCPTTLAYLAEARKKLGAAAQEFRVIYVTVDPERDSTDLLRKYLGAFDPTFVGGTGTPEQLAEVRKAFGITAARQPSKSSPTTYFVHHSSFVYLIDRSGKLRTMMPYGVSADDIAHDVKLMLSE